MFYSKKKKEAWKWKYNIKHNLVYLLTQPWASAVWRGNGFFPLPWLRNTIKGSLGTWPETLCFFLLSENLPLNWSVIHLLLLLMMTSDCTATSVKFLHLGEFAHACTESRKAAPCGKKKRHAALIIVTVLVQTKPMFCHGEPAFCQWVLPVLTSGE